MARQLAALASYPSYRYSQTPVKDSTHFGINQTTPLTLNGELNIPDLSVFKTPPEGHTPVDQKQFVYDEETLKTLQVAHNFSLSFYDKQLNDSGITQQEYLDILDDDAKRCSQNNEAEAIRSNDDDAFEFYTPPDTQGSWHMMYIIYLFIYYALPILHNHICTIQTQEYTNYQSMARYMLQLYANYSSPYRTNTTHSSLDL